MQNEYNYQGTELELFSYARNWKQYVTKNIKKYIIGEVLETGAGPGNFTPYLINEHAGSWTFVEPDANFAAQLKTKKSEYPLPSAVIHGTIGQLGASDYFDTIIYLDVLEHIEDDRKEVQMMISHLKPGGCIIILCPAFNALYSPFDKKIGHYRRYTRRTLLNLFPASLKIVRARYLDSIGLLASAANKLLLKQSDPKVTQIKTWDRFMVPVSRFTDLIFSGIFGRSILVVIQKPVRTDED